MKDKIIAENLSLTTANTQLTNELVRHVESALGTTCFLRAANSVQVLKQSGTHRMLNRVLGSGGNDMN